MCLDAIVHHLDMRSSSVSTCNTDRTSPSSPLSSTAHARSNEHDRRVRIVSPPLITHSQQVVMGRARRLCTDDGSGNVVHHVERSSPPPVIYQRLARAAVARDTMLPFYEQIELSSPIAVNLFDKTTIENDQVDMLQERRHRSSVVHL
jgi:hypothetical protein